MACTHAYTVKAAHVLSISSPRYWDLMAPKYSKEIAFDYCFAKFHI